MLLLGQYILLTHPILLRGCLNLRSNRILEVESFRFPLEPIIVKIYVSLLLESVRRVINVKLLNAIFNFQKHRIIFQFGIRRKTLVQNLLLKLHVFSHFVLVCISIQLKAHMLLFTMSFCSSIIKTFHFQLGVLQGFMLAPIDAGEQVLLHPLLFLIRFTVLLVLSSIIILQH